MRRPQIIVAFSFLFTLITGVCVAEELEKGCISCSEEFKKAGEWRMEAPLEECYTENIAEIILAHCQNGAYSKSPWICQEAQDILIKIHGTAGKTKKLPNGWFLSEREYK